MSIVTLVPVIVGVGIAIQVWVLGKASSGLTPWALSLGLQGAGLLAGSLWASASSSWHEVLAVATQWWWLPLGALGWGLVGLLAFSSGRIGAGSTLALSLASQLVAAVLIDSVVDGNQLAPTTLIGMGLVIAGGVLIARP